MASCPESWTVFQWWLSAATVDGAELQEVHPANSTEPLGAQRGKDASMSQQDPKQRLKLLLLCTYNASGCRRRAGDGTVRPRRLVRLCQGQGECLQPLLNTDFIDNKATITEARHNNCWSKRQVQTNMWSDCTPASFLRVEAFLPPPEKSSLINKARVKWPPRGAFRRYKGKRAASSKQHFQKKTSQIKGPP